MPIIDLASDLNNRTDTPKGFGITPGALDVEFGSDAPEKPSWGQTFGAAFRQDNTVGSALSNEVWNTPQEPEADFNPWNEIKGTKYEPRWESFVNTRNRATAEAVKRQIDREDEDRKVLADAPWYQSVPAQLIAGVADIPTLAPGGAFVRGAKGGLSVSRSALNVAAAGGLATTAQEAALQGMQETRPLSESAVNIGASVVLSGLLGAAGAKLLSRAEWDSAVAKLEADLAKPAPSGDLDLAMAGQAAPVPAGAAAASPTDLRANSIAGEAASSVAAATAKLNPALRLLHSPSAASRETATQLFENSLYLKKNFEGVASEPAVETLMKEWNAGLAQAVRATDDAFSEYVKAGGKLKHHEFREAVGRAMRRNDEDPDPHIAKVAREWRAKVFDPLKDAAIESKLLPEDVSVETAASYFSRMWNRNKLIAQEGRFKAIVQKWVEDMSPTWARAFDQKTAEEAAKLKDAELKNYLAKRQADRDDRFGDAAAIKQSGRDVADNVFNTLTGKAPSVNHPEFARVGVRGPLKERTFSIPDELVEEFLESDIDIVGRRYARTIGADVELTNKFGSVDMQEQIDKIRQNYAELRNGIKSERKLTELTNRERADIRDIEALRDLLRTGSLYKHQVEQDYGRIARIFNHINYIRSMGEVALASLTETIRPAMVHGLMPYMQTLGKLGTNLDGIKLSVREAQLAGNVSERVLGHRLATISEIADPYASRGPVEAFLENLTNIASKWNGIRMLTDMQKSIASVMTQDRMLTNATGNWSKLSQGERAYMNYLGIDQSMAERIAKQFADHGETVDGVKVANTEAWKDDVARRRYRAAINKDIDSIITTKGVADTPLFANTPTGRALLQFKSFALASHQRVLLRGLQERPSRFISGMIAMSTIGMMTTWLKAQSGNRDEKLADFSTNPGWWISEGLDKAGVLAVPMEIANTFEKMTGFNPIKTPVKAFDDTSRLSQKMQNRNEIGALLGPTVGTMQDVLTVGGIPKKLVAGEEVTQGQKNAAERLFPFNSYLGLRQFIRYVVNPPTN